MKKIRVKNVRSLKDTKDIDIKSINVLVGNNSSGKSTFLRIFPLFKQSFARRIKGPILWVGDDSNDVDFGSFEETKTKYANQKDNTKDIEFDFTMKYSLLDIIRNGIDTTLFLNEDNYENIMEKAIIKIGINNKDSNDFISKICLKTKNDTIIIGDDENCVTLNEHKIELLNDDGKRKDVIRNVGLLDDAFSVFTKQELSRYRIMDNFINKVFGQEIIQDFTLKFLLKELIYKMALDYFIEGNNFNIDMTINRYREKIESKTGLFEEFDKIDISRNIKEAIKENLDILKLLFLSLVVNHCIVYLKNYFLNVNYIKPVRAHAERYYRLRNLSVDEIDSDGKNLPMFINSLSKTDFNRYNKWLLENFGFKIDKRTISGHVSLNINVNNNSVNLSDCGYGYSQLLPITTQLWVAMEKGVKNSPIVFAIEQLELHLHPEMQAKLIDIIAKVANEYKGKIQFILETHSETIINRLGNLIYKGKISKDDVNVIIFNKSYQDDFTKIKTSYYDSQGYLVNWPLGFFSVEDIK